MIGSGVAASAVATGMFQDGQRQPVRCLCFVRVQNQAAWSVLGRAAFATSSRRLVNLVPPLPCPPPLSSHRTPGARQWTWSGTRGSVVSGLSTKRRTCRCRSLRYLLRQNDTMHALLSMWRCGGCQKLQTHPPHLSPGCRGNL